MTRVATGPGRAGRCRGRPARLLGRIVAIVVILLWSLFPIYWALNTSLSTLSGADSTPAHYFPSPLVGDQLPRGASGSAAPAYGISGQSSAGRCSTR